MSRFSLHSNVTFTYMYYRTLCTNTILSVWFLSETAGCASGRKEEEREGVGAEGERSGGAGGEAEGWGRRNQEEASGAGGGEGVAAEEERGVPEGSGEDAGGTEEAGERKGVPEERYRATGGRKERRGQGLGDLLTCRMNTAPGSLTKR